MRSAVRVHHFAQNDTSVLAACIRVQSQSFQDAVRALALSLHGGTAVKTPVGYIGKGGRDLKRLQQRLAAQAGNGMFAVQPDVFEFVFVHSILETYGARAPVMHPLRFRLQSPKSIL